MNKDHTAARLRLAWLFYGMMFFYGIEQLFLNRVIKDPSARAYLTVVYVAALVVFDIPTGVLADRVSRKLCLQLAGVFQLVALLILGSSQTVLEYVIGSLFFGVFVCLINGAAQALLYDWLASQNQTKLYAKDQGRNYAAFLIGAGIANIASGFIANALSLRSTYFLSMIPAAISILLVAGLNEPQYKKKQAPPWRRQLKDIVLEIGHHKKILVFSVHFIAAAILLYTVGEFGQIYLLSFGISAATLGVLWAITAAFAAGGRALAHRLQDYPRLFIVSFCAIAMIFSIAQSKWGIGLFWLIYGLNEALTNVAETEVQHHTSSHVRATTLSVISFLGNIISVPIILLYNRYYLDHGISGANRMVCYAVVIVLVLTLFVRSDVGKTARRLL